MTMTSPLMHPRDWSYLIVADSGLVGKGGATLPHFIGPFSSPGIAESWGSLNIKSGKWHVTDLATLDG